MKEIYTKGQLTVYVCTSFKTELRGHVITACHYTDCQSEGHCKSDRISPERTT